MFRSRWTLPCVLALISALWLASVASRVHPAARLNLKYDRAGYLALGRQLSINHGVAAGDASGYARVETLAKNQDLRFMMPANKTVQMFPEAQVTVNLLPAGKSTGPRITFGTDGHPLGWKFPESLSIKPAPSNSPENAMRELAGDDSNTFEMANPGSVAGATRDMQWQHADEGKNSTASPHVSIDESEKKGAVFQADTVFTIPDAIGKKLDSFNLVRTIVGPIWFILLFAAVAIPVLREGSGRTARAMMDSSARWIGIAAALAVAVGSMLEWDDEVSGVSAASGLLIEVLGVLVGGLIVGLLLYAMAAGTVLNASLHPARARGFRLLGSKAVLSRTVAHELLAGWVIAPVLVALPLALSLILRSPAFRGYDDTMLLSRFPVLMSLVSTADQSAIAVVALFGVLIPLARRFVKRAWLSGALAIAMAALTLIMLSAPFREAQIANVTWAVLQGCLLFWIYSRFGMLAAVAGYGWAKILNSAIVLVIQPAAGLHGSGQGILLTFAALGFGALLVSLKGPDAVAELYGESGVRLQARSRREELLAEFNVARSAQQQMLPARAPSLEGYSLAASCDPAREVGGDLYDFLRLKDGRLGIGVADVSGKGVPAALYMGLTKGLLSAAAQDSGDPHYILGVVNKHLREVAKKKVFVTMALGVLDPAERTLEYARAGHNPVVWRRASARQTHLLGGGGIGLGIAGPVLFARTLKVETLVLAPGDALIFYSDGLTEAMDELQEQFGEERLIAAAEKTDGLDAGATRDSILREVKHFLKGGNSQDDLTIAVLRVNEASRQSSSAISN